MKQVPILSSVFDKSWVIVLVLLLFFGAIVISVIMIRKHSNLFKNDEKPKSEKEVAEEEVSRILENVEDPVASEAIQNFKEEKKKDDDDDDGEDKPLLS